ncbi:MAG TPA: CPBP family intramembrane glutamic endopeptidase [Iamia sp.]|nr:CPBP family intramembrane glutamic endopeptidase [Iamia sp.]
MTATSPAPARPDAVTEPPPWGMGEVALAALATLVISAVLGGLILGVADVKDTDDASLVTIALIQTTLWVGMLGSIAVVLRRRGASLRRLGLRARWVDVPVGIVAGVLGQLVLVPVISWPWVTILGKDSDELMEPACRLADKADDPLGIVLLFAITVIGAPIVEELFFRGFVQQAAVSAFTRNVPTDDDAADADAALAARRLGTGFGLVLTAILFGVIHFQVLQAPALVVFGLLLGVLARRSGRLGSSIVTHMAFNATTVVSLVVMSSSFDDQCGDVLGAVGRLGGWGG